ncbi:hypothetical protein CEXT_55271 [Caerostris extrusa]|uniref:Uncharacterized protein n=1 Tax=Caerostris extrusa TaxID=172846 RepID=A0AAV4QB43_CAEEX|nr:hypothetical protein CEXT_55271 [Caerostris extrusa]
MSLSSNHNDRTSNSDVQTRRNHGPSDHPPKSKSTYLKKSLELMRTIEYPSFFQGDEIDEYSQKSLLTNSGAHVNLKGTCRYCIVLQIQEICLETTSNAKRYPFMPGRPR